MKATISGFDHDDAPPFIGCGWIQYTKTEDQPQEPIPLLLSEHKGEDGCAAQSVTVMRPMTHFGISTTTMPSDLA